MTLDDQPTLRTGPEGLVTLNLDDGAVAGVARAAGMLAEPFVVGAEDADHTVTLKLWSDGGGTRWTMHSGGDVMFGRRYNVPTQGEPLIPRTAAAAGAQGVVSSLAGVFKAANVRTLNLETVISDLPDGAAYPGKRFILNSWPDTLAGVKLLDPSFVLLANNHARDYMDRGVTETTQALKREGLQFTGASDNGETAPDDPVIVRVGDLKVGTLAWTTVDGSFVNDSYPKDGDAPPADLASADRWQWQKRKWGFQGATLSVPVAPHRIGSVWASFKGVESALSEKERAAAWSSMIAVFPELQDWVARRGHGGAAPWTKEGSAARIKALRQQADIVVVQLHAGFQFQPAPSDYVASVARDVIDAGADMVICHHPHVLQGTEWYKDKLIVFSLGNFVFDQDFAATFSTVFLRTVWEGAELLEARFIPLEIVGYRPVPSADAAARRTLLRLWEMSMAESRAARTGDGVRVIATSLSVGALPGQLRFERNTAVVVRESPAVRSVNLETAPGAIQAIGYDGLIDPRLGLEVDESTKMEVGRELLGWGDFEDPLADHQATNNAQWAFDDDASYKRVIVADDAPSGSAYLHFARSKQSTVPVMARPVARTPLLTHRLFRSVSAPGTGEQSLEAADPEPHYSLRMQARSSGKGQPFVRLDLYFFDDTNPTEDPSSIVVGQAEIPLHIPSDGDFHPIEVPIDRDLTTTAGVRANMVMFYVGLRPVAEHESTLDVDAMEVIEWRDARRMPDRFGVYDYVRSFGSSDRTLSLRGLPAR